MSELIILSFIQFRLLDIIDILFVAVLLYQLYKLMKGTVAINIFLGITAIYLLWKLVEALEMDLLGEILGQFISVGVIALIVVFQQEIRKFLLLLGTPAFMKKKQKRFLNFRFWQEEKEEFQTAPVMNAFKKLGASKTGALIVIARQNELRDYAEAGELMDARISARLLENIFFKNSPLHDGALIIKGNRIMAAGCVLPLSQNKDFPATYGLRHRAATGITENTDAISLIVSEETGKFGMAVQGKLSPSLSLEELAERLHQELE